MDIRLNCFLLDETRSGRFRKNSPSVSGDCLGRKLDASDEPRLDESAMGSPSFFDGSFPSSLRRPLLEHATEETTSADVIEIASSNEGEIKCEQSDSSEGSEALTTSSSEDEAGASHTGAARAMKLPTVLMV